jgi:hypothetical protein
VNRNTATANNSGVAPTVQGLRRMAAFNFAGLRFRFGIVLTTTTTVHTANQQQRRQLPAMATAATATDASTAAAAAANVEDASSNETRCQFHQHFMSSFCAKKLQTQIVST